MLDLEKQIRKRSRVRTRISKAANDLKQEISKGKEADPSELSELLAVLVSINDQLSDLDEKILRQQEDILDEEDLVKEEDEINEVTSLVVRLEAKTNCLLKIIEQAKVRDNPTDCSDQNAKLPKINVPIFSGKIEDWRSWYSMYQALVYNRSISAVEKFSYLLGCLEGEAKAMVKGVALKEENFEPTLKSLRERFGDPTTLLCMHVVSLHKLIPLSDAANPIKVRSMINDFETHVREVRSIMEELGDEISQPQSTDLDFLCDIFLSPLLMSKLPDSIMTEWNRKASKTKERFKYSTLLSFVKSELESKESLSLTKVSREDRTQNRSFRGSESHSGNSASCTFGSRSEKPCLCCQQVPWHRFSECDVFLNQMTCQERRKFLDSKHLCQNCFGTRHDARICKSKQKCHLCRMKHHTLLHREEKNAQALGKAPPTRNSRPNYQKESSVTNCSNQNDYDECIAWQQPPNYGETASPANPAPKEHSAKLTAPPFHPIPCTSFNSTALSPFTASILETVQVRMQGPKGEMVARVFLDSGSDSSFIRSDVVSKLGLPTIDEKWADTVVFGGNIKRELRRLVQVQMFPLIREEQQPIRLKFWTSDKLTSPLAHVKVSPEILACGPFS